jgi:predicted nucleic acid-binding protein
MVLVDTSVWVRALAGRAPYRHELDRLLERSEVVGHQLVFGELLMGDTGSRHDVLFLYDAMRQAILVPHEEVVQFVRNHRLHGRGIGWIDVHLLASAIVGHLQLWTADAQLATIASELGRGYSI